MMRSKHKKGTRHVRAGCLSKDGKTDHLRSIIFLVMRVEPAISV